ncbi:hypothetical protein ACFL2C_01970 [Patescibacteria group bacterium]
MDTIGFLSATLDILGKVMVSYTAIAVHYRVWKEHKMDEAVFGEMKKERVIGALGIIFMVLAYLIKLPHYF